MAIDRRNLKVLANFCSAAADAMAFTLMRTAHSAFVKETEDFSCQVVTREGLAFANPRQFGAPWYSGIDYAPLISMFEEYEDGDICITNDPYSGFVATHSPDIHIWKPVFHEGKIACFVVGHIHNTDVGGAVPASLSRSLSEIEQEGLRIPPVKLVRKGRLDPFIIDMMKANVRMPEQNIGDLHAQIASVNIGERKMQEIVARFGFDDFLDGVRQIFDYAEEQTRQILTRVPDGDYFFADYADEDSVGGRPCRVALTLKIRGGEAVLDYTGSDPQLGSSLNMPTGGRERHSLVMVGLTYVLYTLDNSLLLNAGTLRPVRAVLPEGTIVNCQRPAAVGMRSLTCAMTQIVTIGAFAKALPELIPAASPGGNAIMNIKTSDRSGRPVMASIGPVGGGGGGTPFCDGSDGAGGATGFLRNTPIEISEAEVPILFRRYGLQRDTGGAGHFRGGLSAIMEFEISSPETVVTARNRNRSLMASWGVNGAGPGLISRFLRNPDTEGEISLGNTDIVHCGPGDVIRVIGPGAGGYGDPFTRPQQAVLRDVRRGAVSAENAARHYGVALIGDEIDEEATAALRSTPRRKTDDIISYGPERLAFEAVWTRERYDLLTQFLQKSPVGWRFFLKHRVFEAVENEGDDPRPLCERMAGIFDRISARYGV
ncbi:hydantoinase B/oxoprolinase family protein [Agrobacterium radiobacter]|jgi:N-methylhydantoinase B|uniref:Hydantoinase B/oxoprolinase family protein n=2 Tax=Agrobacterium tumefaciens TaxID=358 RepID=A0AAP9E6P0_AGRTU|nr:hydantoinase B/oxoprolinase family protein [Agrobacterium tumefaciens]KWT84687.1 hydantoin utilization protein B [Agrobacterium tumefaciens str. B6]MCW8056982.1 hydantoinase B/oxoprolinase family protein [Agrobacterium tumefaciens]MCW8142317.1 hydantoinase B/oxoprolinase family protein [Agrobacterium tumefaciens]MQB24619.1 hydantoinase B/oxoprolinase family protein [Agrobacterium tumefaciens]NSZ59470.1 hydantoinase B/oxoprolinase family protein [Agrobacterium tumefaciens]